MRRLSIVWLIVTVSILASCQKDEPTNPLEESRKQLLGRWEWVQTEYNRRGAPAPVLETPASTGKRQILEFREDQQVNYRVNDTLKGTYHYEVSQPTGNEFWLEVHGLLPFLPSGIAPVTITNQEMLIQANYNDLGGNSTFKKQ